MWLISDSLLDGATSWLQSLSLCSNCGGRHASITLFRLLSFAASVYGLRPMLQLRLSAASPPDGGSGGGGACGGKAECSKAEGGKAEGGAGDNISCQAQGSLGSVRG